MKYVAIINGTSYTIAIEETEQGPQITLNDTPVTVDQVSLPDSSSYSMLKNNRSHTVCVHQINDNWILAVDGRVFEVTLEDVAMRQLRRTLGRQEQRQEERILAPMPGLVVAVEVAEGEKVNPGQGIVIVEAMKMQNELKARQGGRVKEIHVQAGINVNKGEVLVVLE